MYSRRTVAVAWLACGVIFFALVCPVAPTPMATTNGQQPHPHAGPVFTPILTVAVVPVLINRAADELRQHPRAEAPDLLCLSCVLVC